MLEGEIFRSLTEKYVFLLSNIILKQSGGQLFFLYERENEYPYLDLRTNMNTDLNVQQLS